MTTSHRAAGAALALALLPATLRAAENADCLACHEDSSLVNGSSQPVTVDARALGTSVHADLRCTNCHSQPGDFSTAPHFDRPRKVECAQCHGEAAASFHASFHGQAAKQGVANAPDCVSCHRTGPDPHSIQPLTKRSAENSCRKCHGNESKGYDTSVHAEAAKTGKPSPGCTGCHATHSRAYPPSAGAINGLCEKCHTDAMTQVSTGVHKQAGDKMSVMSCASCHDVHATHKPHMDEHTLEACQTCHPGYREQFKGSVHEARLAVGEMTCLTCHRTHQIKDASEVESFGCGACHVQAEEAYRKSAHRLARLHGNKVAATCGGCHSGHHVVAPTDPQSPVNRRHIPDTCGKCHTDRAVITTDYVRLPISLPSYNESVHGVGWRAGKLTAVCTDCHGIHDLQSAAALDSTIHKENLAQTCGKCHTQIAQEYLSSVHGRALAHGILDSPSCTDCHEEHLILPVNDPKSPVRPGNVSTVTCARCHEDPGMAARYGLPAEVIKSYKDSYHGWAIARGGKAVAVCTDCHNKHAIGSLLDPASPIHKSNVVHTCAKCHPNANAEFAASYTHVLARGRLMIHDWVRLVYIWLIALVLGGMLLHNLVIYVFELRHHYRRQKSAAAVERMTKAGVMQHWVLLISFFGLAISGFALRFPDSWWAQGLSAIGFNEEIRRLFHRGMAILMVLGSVFHVFHVFLTIRGRRLARAMLPNPGDAFDALGTILYYLGLRRDRPTFGMFDYTQKAEYWALIWGTFIMALTGFILWFPTQATSYLPAWTVRVAEVVHFYEAILAVAAIFIWHFFFVIVRPEVYPMSWTWVTGRMPLTEWRHHHGRAAAEVGDLVKELSPDGEADKPPH
jgi:formate dehydrogenase gamma subunit